MPSAHSAPACRHKAHHHGNLSHGSGVVVVPDRNAFHVDAADGEALGRDESPPAHSALYLLLSIEVGREHMAASLFYSRHLPIPGVSSFQCAQNWASQHKAKAQSKE
jgi:hypothetical protein